jgi:threonine synthase
MWRWRDFLPMADGELPVTLGEGNTPLLETARLGASLGLDALWVKDEAVNPTGAFKARGLGMAITRATLSGARQFVIPTAGNAGVSAAAYASRAGARARVYAPRTTPAAILAQIITFGGDLVLIDGHIGDCGKAARTWAAETGAVDLSTLKEPYRIEGKKTLGLEIAEQLGWHLPDVILYPTGGGTGLIGMWKAFEELRKAGWVEGEMPRLFSVQSTGCAPMVRAFEAGAETATPWQEPWTIASGLRVPGPLGDKLMLAILRQVHGGAIAVEDQAMMAAAARGSSTEGIDFSPEGGATLAAIPSLLERGLIRDDDRVIAFNTGAGWLYRRPEDLLQPGG